MFLSAGNTTYLLFFTHVFSPKPVPTFGRHALTYCPTALLPYSHGPR
ncbi:hypothetical protein DK52_3266 [Brucella abortus]|nr:hypothetical protein DK52_3266 [Brucella abortus]